MSPRTVVFDFDGVLIRGDSTVDVLRRRVRRAPWLVAPTAVAGAGFALSGRHSPARTWWSRRVVGTLGVGRDLRAVEAELQELARAVHQDPARLPSRTVRALRDHLDRGDRVLVSSAGLGPFVRTWIDLLGATGAVVAASTLEQRAWGVAMADHQYGERKLVRAAELGFDPPFHVVYSDSDADIPLLERAERPVLISPSERTLRSLPAAVRGRAEVWRDEEPT